MFRCSFYEVALLALLAGVIKIASCWQTPTANGEMYFQADPLPLQSPANSRLLPDDHLMASNRSLNGRSIRSELLIGCVIKKVEN